MPLATTAASKRKPFAKSIDVVNTQCSTRFGGVPPDRTVDVSPDIGKSPPTVRSGTLESADWLCALRSTVLKRSWKVMNEAHDEMVGGHDGLSPLSQRVEAPAELPLPEANGGVRWRPLERSDLENVRNLWNAADLVDDPTTVTTLDEIIEEFEDPMFDAKRDGIVGLDQDDRVVACGTVTRSSINETIVWIQLEGTVHPERRGEGIGATLLDWQERRGRQHLAASEEALPGWLTADVSEHAVAASRLLTTQGFRGVRWWFDMERDLSAPLPEVALPADMRFVDYTPDRTEAARLTFNEAFRDHWGSQPHTAREWAISERRPEFRANLSSLISVANGDGASDTVAVLTSEVPEHEWEARGSKFAHISGVAVRRPWRGRGLARAMIVNAMRAYRDAGLEVAALSVDTENPTGALDLYQSLGFVPTERSTTHVKAF